MNEIRYRLIELLCRSAVAVPPCKSDNCLCWISSSSVSTACLIAASSQRSATSYTQQSQCRV